MTKKQRIQEIALELGTFHIRRLAEECVRADIFADEKLDDMLVDAAMAKCKAAIKEKTESGVPLFVCVKEGAQAIWRDWLHCSKAQSRRAIQILARKGWQTGKVVRAMVEAHERRFRERLLVPTVRTPTGWDPDAEFPLIQGPNTPRTKH